MGRNVGLMWFGVGSLLLLCSCAQPINNTAVGALGGTALGAGLGAIIGSQTGDAGRGVAIGAAAGALGGALVGTGLDAGERENNQIRSDLDRQQAQIDENQRLIDELRRRGADAYRTDRGVVVNLPDVLFEFDRAGLTYDAQETVREIADVVRTAPGRSIAIEGHTDSVGSDSYNQRLSEDRAASVARELRSEGAGSLRVRGFGESRPIASNTDSVGRARNRRVEVIIEN